MPTDLDKLKTQLPPELESRGFVVFHGLSRAGEESDVVMWDTVQRPEYGDFLDCAGKLGIKLIVFNTRALEKVTIDDLQEEIETMDFSSTERRDLERRLRALKPYTGFTANLEMSFDFNGSTYVYEIRSEFMNEFLAILNEVDVDLYPGGDFEDDEPENPSGFFSRN